jgi:hypothetical protein
MKHGITRFLQSFHMERIAFRTTESFRKIKNMSRQSSKKFFNPDEQDILLEEMLIIFEDSFREIKNLCPTLTNNDILFCFLRKLCELRVESQNKKSAE